MLAYVFWHRPAPGHEPAAYERALERFHNSLRARPPSGFNASASFRAKELPWLEREFGPDAWAAGWYEDWYLLDGWSSVGVLEEAAVARGHASLHDAVAALAGHGAGGMYRLSEGHAKLERARAAVWVTPAPGHAPPTMADLLGDGMDPEAGGLWRRSLVLGPAPEYCLLTVHEPAGVAASRLPAGWSATCGPREPIWPG